MSDQVEMEQEENKETTSAITEKCSEKKRFEVKKWNAVALWAWGDYIYSLILKLR